MHVVTNLSNAVLELSLPDEDMISIQMADIMLSMRRQTPSKLAEIQIGNAFGHFALPADFEVTNTSFVDMQVKSSFTFVILTQFISPGLLLYSSILHLYI